MSARSATGGAAATLMLLFGCDFAHLQHSRYESTFREAGLERKRAELGDDVVAYWQGGSGPPVLLVAGFGSQAVWHWHTQVEALAPGRRLLVPDPLWSGASSSKRPDYGTAHQAEALIALLDREGVEKVDVVGLSYGGFVAWLLAARHPERVRKLVLISSPGSTYTSSDMKALCQRQGVADPYELFAPRDAEGFQRLLTLAFGDPPWVPNVLADQAVEALYNQDRPNHRKMMAAATADLEQADTIPMPVAPTLLVWGEDDPIFPLELSKRVLTQLGARARRVVIPKARHAPNLEWPDEVNQTVKAFLDEPLAGALAPTP